MRCRRLWQRGSAAYRKASFRDIKAMRQNCSPALPRLLQTEKLLPVYTCIVLGYRREIQRVEGIELDNGPCAVADTCGFFALIFVHAPLLALFKTSASILHSRGQV
ncbi:hypothetical protein P171DRAFT_200135 [Karstenula rhodostoma CBS 690.94]|uniref:Uncharacterized protein n=1 Tax=Karstenula rhodostoma CBS 690.94 TaxID=1392251 RepID=A0A9P4PVR6_9PLEO|nr:hypothetical protein P171DRAFT_200135 [Karstenula rhodostoma CBS 690.94]